MKHNYRELSKAMSSFLATFEADKVPPGYLSLNEWGAVFNVSVRMAWNNIYRFIKAGHCERAVFRVKTSNSIRPVAHYRLSKPALKGLGLTLPRR